MSVGFELLVAAAAVIAGAIASLAGFGIGGILTPLLAWALGTKLAVAVVSVPHLIGTALRFGFIYRHVNRKVLVSFGIASAVGGLTGALLHVWLSSVWLGYILGVLLVFAGIMGLTGWAQRLRFGGTVAWIAGILSGGFGGLVGNQGGIRSAALFGFDLDKQSFVATATAIALMVDFFRMPVYAATQWRQVVGVWPVLVLAIIGIVTGTLAGQPVLRRIPDTTFRKTVAGIILLLGIWMLMHP
ncbi:MAG TPA: sulfite exporter TauE/SafE family protein [Terriglobales bacterium]|nr:sulfite exporter TauE/SafE family protein [Terriglobales bacterium]